MTDLTLILASASPRRREILENLGYAVRTGAVPIDETPLAAEAAEPYVLRMAQQKNHAALAVHGRTRSQMYRGEAEYALIAEVKRRTRLPLWVNGDITSPQKAAAVLAQTGADGVMVGRAAQGQPWLFADIRHYLTQGSLPPPQTFQAAAATALEHIRAIHEFYEAAGTRIARKHIGWYLQALPDSDACRRLCNQSDSAAMQYDALAQFFAERAQQTAYWPRSY